MARKKAADTPNLEAPEAPIDSPAIPVSVQSAEENTAPVVAQQPDVPPAIGELVEALNTIMRDEFSVQVYDSSRLVLASAAHGDEIEIPIWGDLDLKRMGQAAFKKRLFRGG